MPIVLASASPRRRALLEAAGIPHEVAPADVDETPVPHEAPGDYVLRLARAKVRRCVRRSSGTYVLGADTTVVVDAQILGKPETPADAADMLQLLAGRAHHVLTGVVVARQEHELSAVISTRVHFLPLTDAEIAWYVASGEPFGKAGAYAIQGLGSRFVDRIEGSYSNVVGLPVAEAYAMLAKLGWSDENGSQRDALDRDRWDVHG
jgi:septum formation protein